MAGRQFPKFQPWAMAAEGADELRPKPKARAHAGADLHSEKMNTFLEPYIREFCDEIGAGRIEVYNEASIQYELAIFLRAKLDGNWRVQLERNISFFGLAKSDFLKKEMDIIIY